jgi:hypothetical protein
MNYEKSVIFLGAIITLIILVDNGWTSEISVNKLATGFNISSLYSDKVRETPWCASTHGKAPEVTLKNYSSSGYMGIVNGMTLGDFYNRKSITPEERRNYFKQYSRAKDVDVITDGVHKRISLKDDNSFQIVKVDPFRALKFQIISFYPGNDTSKFCLSKFIFDNYDMTVLRNIVKIVAINKTMNIDEIKTKVGPLYKHNKRQLFYYFGFLMRDLPEGGLRLLLNLHYFGSELDSVIDAETLEYYGDLITSYFDENYSLSIVKKVITDRRQINRDAIVSSFYNYIGDINLDNQKDPRVPHALKLKSIIDAAKIKE